MGFSGGGSNILKSHRHDGTVIQDGGSLDFNNITQSNSSAGQIFYSDGVHLQQLTYPGVPAGETLTAAPASTAPSWAAGSAGAWTNAGSDTNTTAAAALTVTVTDADVYHVIYNVSDDDDGSDLLTCQINGITGPSYDNLSMSTPDGASPTGDRNASQNYFRLSTSMSGGVGHSGVFYLYKANSNFTANARRGVTLRGIDNMYGGAISSPSYITDSTAANQDITGAITEIKLLFTSQDIIGNVRVNSLTY